MKIQGVFSGISWAVSVTQGSDGQALNVLFEIHAPSDPIILDATYGQGKMWQDCAYRPDITMDRRALPGVQLVEDFTVMSSVADSSVDIIVFDPPHLPTAAASEQSSGIWQDRYGITADDPLRAGDNVIPLFVPFLTQARRVLRPEGVIFAKIADIIHNHRYQWQMCAFVGAAAELGLTPCDLLIRVDPKGANLKSSKWSKQKHLRHNHCYWIIVRNGDKCERKDS